MKQEAAGCCCAQPKNKHGYVTTLNNKHTDISCVLIAKPWFRKIKSTLNNLRFKWK